MNKINIVLVCMGLFIFSCADENLKPIITFDDAGKGAYPALISETSKLINLFDVPGSAYDYNIEFIDVEGGALVAQYALDVTYESVNGNQGPSRLKEFSAGDFETNGDGNKALSNISISSGELLGLFGLEEADLSPGDNFAIDGAITTVDGAVFRAGNSSPTVNGAGFRGHFAFDMPVGCPSDLTGTFEYTTTGVWCDASTVTGTVEILDKGAGTYHFSDWAFGAYAPCYGAGSVAAQPDLTFGETCAVVKFTGFVDSFGDTWTFDSSIDGEVWTINWENTYGEAGNSTITFPGGVPFTLAE